jgi:hypothetical protein
VAENKNFEFVLRSFLELYASKDLDSISKLLASSVVLRDWNLQVSGKDATLAQFKKNFEEAQSISISVSNVYTSTSGACAELEIVVNQSLSLRVVDVVIFDSDGLLTSIVSYKGL